MRVEAPGRPCNRGDLATQEEALGSQGSVLDFPSAPRERVGAGSTALSRKGARPGRVGVLWVSGSRHPACARVLGARGVSLLGAPQLLPIPESRAAPSLPCAVLPTDRSLQG